ncbi:helicase-exonuclease AddAB subunit AddB [Macrococcoides caseolyticum]|uniref:helicase-exonuclease AddAB subunit AddB n=1 Tax=Macrococcoides caseolyticum TaxID=69966 RepID=UPI001F257A19|nr:helicase-exonuclease AddAB subunit AddB [Macrococcus caseolyticus]MCE4955754.1 helicase-exonuclease AddAB subunit AddB [Macrococcus caseolyticus]
MTISFLLGRRGTGKTHALVESIKQKIKEQPLGDPIIMIAPRQSTFSIEQALSQDKNIKGSMRTAIYSFDRLYWRLKSELGGTDLTPISKAGVEMLTYDVIATHQSELKRFKTSSQYYGFSQKLSQTISELKKYHVSAEDIHSLMHEQLEVRTQDKLHDIALIYDALEKEMAHEFMQSEDTLYHLIQLIEQSETIKKADILIDGFYNFTTIEYLVITALCQHARSVSIALTLDPVHQSDLFRKTEETFNNLKAYLTMHQLSFEIITFTKKYRFNTPALSYLEENFDAALINPPSDCITILEAENLQAEVNAIMHKIFNLGKNDYRYKDIAVLYRDESYAQALVKRAKQIGIPYHTDLKEKMHHHHSIEMIRSLLDFFKNTYQLDHLFRALKTGLLTKSMHIDLQFADMLENVMITRGMRYQDLLEKRKLHYSKDDMYSTEEWAQFLNDVDHTIQLIEPFRKALTSADNATIFATQLYQFIELIELPVYLMLQKDKMIEAGQNYQALEFDQLLTGINQVLDDFVQVLHDRTMDYKTMAEIIDVGFEALEFSAAPQGLDQIQILNIDLAKIENKKCVFICGFNDEILPRRIKEDAIITDSEKRRISELGGLKLSPTTDLLTQDERFVAYIAMSNATDELYLSYSLMNLSYEAMRPSPYIQDLKQMQCLNWVYTKDFTPKQLITTIQSGVSIAARHFDDEAFKSVKAFYMHNGYQSIFELVNYRNQTTPIHETNVNHLYGDTIKASVSRFETFNQCAFKHFASHGLRLRPRDNFEIQSFQLGNIYHEVLAYLSEAFKDNILKVTKEEIRLAIRAYLQQHLPTVQFEIMYSKQHYRFMILKIEAMLTDAFTMIQTHQKNSGFKMSKFETRFGRQGPLQSQQIILNSGQRVEISGQIDRIDILNQMDHDYVSVIDYKSGHTELDLRKVYYGIQMQMMTYMDVVLQNKKALGLKDDVIPAGMLYFHVYEPKLKLNNKQELSQDLIAMRRNKYKMEGYIVDDQAILPYFDESIYETSKSDIVPVSLKKSGEFTQASKVLPVEVIHKFIQHNRNNFKTTAENVLQGNCQINPFMYEHQLPCKFCDFKAVCHIDALLNGNDIREMKEKIDPIEAVMKGDQSSGNDMD